jgi:hypothetical protein
MSPNQTRLWNLCFQRKAEGAYMKHYLHDHCWRRRWCSIITTAASSGSLLGWAIWNSPKWNWILQIVIMSSQIIEALRDELPWFANHDNITRALAAYESDAIDLEEHLDKALRGEIAENDIAKIVTTSQKTISRKIDEIFGGNLPDLNGKHGEKAQTETTTPKIYRQSHRVTALR